VWLRRSLAVALAVAFVSGCSWSDSKTYNVPDVVVALGNHGFHVGVVAPSDMEQDVHQVFPQVVPDGVQSMVAEREQQPGPEGTRGALVLSALIFRTQGKASCGKSNLIGTCLRKRNVVVVVRNNRANAAREALDDLD
jgi:hypothetical protein